MMCYVCVCQGRMGVGCSLALSPASLSVVISRATRALSVCRIIINLTHFFPPPCSHLRQRRWKLSSSVCFFTAPTTWRVARYRKIRREGEIFSLVIAHHYCPSYFIVLDSHDIFFGCEQKSYSIDVYVCVSFTVRILLPTSRSHELNIFDYTCWWIQKICYKRRELMISFWTARKFFLAVLTGKVKK